MSVAQFSLGNVQGDILFGLPKQAQSWFLFQIDQPDAFRSNLADLVPLITTAEQTKGNITEIRQFKIENGLDVTEGDGETVHPDVITVSGVNIAFSATGLRKIGITDNTNDRLFEAGMKSDGVALGDKTKDGQLDWEDTFLQEIHGVALVTGDSRDSLNEKLASVKDILSTSVKEIKTITGDVRPGDQKGHEHFGYLDGVSNPAVKDIEEGLAKNAGQSEIPQGVALLGRDGDSTSNRPDWALDGSFLALRKLPQLVPEFDKFLLEKGETQEGADLLGARMVGRWKSGAPLMLADKQDDPELGADVARNNDFTFTPGDQSKCPFAAHIRKTNPRGHLSDDTIARSLILRRGIPFGPEVSDEEKQSGKTASERGLLFACYQSNLGDGFSFVQKQWANPTGFPFGTDVLPGTDPLVGQVSNEDDLFMSGAFASNTTETLKLQSWVTSQGGEYFFSPSIPTLKNVFAKA